MVVIADTTTPVTVTSVTVAPDSVFLQPGAGQAFQRHRALERRPPPLSAA
ncbi:MAG: hypothetical protein IPK12_24455 [Gemmatimonadetes bacterium]|nr:hypothetical protein [Gemmatimonadota bacterium]